MSGTPVGVDGRGRGRSCTAGRVLHFLTIGECAEEEPARIGPLADAKWNMWTAHALRDLQAGRREEGLQWRALYHRDGNSVAIS